jgi:hypothetical protein
MKSYFSLLILLFAFVKIVSGLEEDNYPFKFVQASGILYEKKANQDIMFVAQGRKVNPYLLKQLVLREEKRNEIYFTKLNCQEKEEIYDYSYIKCKIDLSKIKKGFYKMAVFFYANDDYRNNELPPLLILGDKEEDEELKILNAFTEAIEYSKSQEIHILFNKKVEYPNRIKNIFIHNSRGQRFQVPLYCDDGNVTNYTNYECEGDFSKVGEGMYVIDYLEYNYNYTYPARNISIVVYRQKIQELKLLSLKGEILEGNVSFLNLTFNRDVNGSEFGRFYVYSQNTTYSLYKRMIRQYNRTSIEVELESYNITSGYYNFGFYYKGYNWRFDNIYVYVRENSYYPWNFRNFFLNLLGTKNKPKAKPRK